jgi:phosphatidylinositol-3-phosphatase
MRLLSCLALTLALLALASATAAAATPPIKHVWIIVLENKDYEDSFGPDTEAPYLAHELTKSGQLLQNYFGTSHASLGNYITMVSGMAPNADTQGDCMAGFKDIFPGVIAPDGQVVGQGCVYPAGVKTIANQLQEKGLTWRGYMEDMGNTPGAPRTCRHPKIGDSDDTQSARKNDQYATRHNPFMYFHSVIDDQANCDSHVVPLDQLLQDVKSPSTTPNYGFITPDLCNDGHDPSCADGGPGGLQAADAFLQRWVPTIMASPGFKDSGLLIVTWDEANISPESSTACCDEQTGPNTPSPGILGPGGGRTGTVLISPFIQPGSVNKTEYNHYGLLRSVEDLFGLGHLGYASRDGLRPFGADVFNASNPAPPPKPQGVCRAARSGKAVAGVRLRGRLLTFRGRRKARIRITVHFAKGRHGRRLKRPTRVAACRTYRVRVPRGTRRVTISGAGHSQRAHLKPSGEHYPG